MKIIIAGDGKVGSMLARQLSAEGHDITLVDNDPDALESTIERYDVMSVQGNCASMEVLRNAGVDSADLLITATGQDEINLLCCLTALVGDVAGAQSVFAQQQVHWHRRTVE